MEDHSMDPWSLLPLDMQVYILSRLEVPDVLACRCVNHTWKQSVDRDRVWQALYQRLYDSDASRMLGNTDAPTWRAAFVHRYTQPQRVLWRMLKQTTQASAFFGNPSNNPTLRLFLHPNEAMDAQLDRLPVMRRMFSDRAAVVAHQVHVAALCRMLLLLVAAAVVMVVVELLYPDFLNYWQYVSRPFTWNGFVAYTPALVYGFGVACVWIVASRKSLTSMGRGTRILGWALVDAISTGVVEELGYRYLFVCSAMIGVQLLRLALRLMDFGAVIAWIRLLARLIRLPNAGPFWLAMLAFIVFVAGLFFDFVEVFFEYCVVPLAKLLTAGFFDEIFSHEQRLMVYGLIVANVVYRDAGKFSFNRYLSWIHRWILGFVFIHATLTHGLAVSIVLNIAYNVQFVLITAIARCVLSGATVVQVPRYLEAADGLVT